MIAAIVAYLFTPLYNKLRAKLNGGLATTLTVLAALGTVVIPLIGVIPESEDVLQASNQGVPAVHMEGTDVSEAYKDVIDRFLGEDKPLRFIDAQKPSFLKRLFGGK